PGNSLATFAGKAALISFVTEKNTCEIALGLILFCCTISSTNFLVSSIISVALFSEIVVAPLNPRVIYSSTPFYTTVVFLLNKILPSCRQSVLLFPLTIQIEYFCSMFSYLISLNGLTSQYLF